METLRIYFADFWKSFDMQDNYFWNLLSEHYQLVLDPVKPEILFYSYMGLKDVRKKTFHRYPCIRIFYTGENIRPDFNECDFALSYDYSKDKRNLRLPLYVLYNDFPELINRQVPDDLLIQKTKFCCFVVSNPNNPIRNEFFHKLSAYKKVDSGGRYLNNIGGSVEDKLAFMKPYKFVISFENDSYPGYVTEKIYEPKLVDALPIYWGDPLISNEFNTASFINFQDFKSMDAVIDHVKMLDKNDEKYMEAVKAPFFKNDTPNEFVDKARVLAFLQNIIEHRTERRPLGATWKRFMYLYRNPLQYLLLYYKIAQNYWKRTGSTV